MPSEPLYFPVHGAPLKMVAGLRRHGEDCGQGPLDQLFFQRDERCAQYLNAKRNAPAERHVVAGEDVEAYAARAAALAWLRETLAREHAHVLEAIDADGAARDPFDAVARHVQEDLVVLHAGEHDDGRVVMLDMRFPSGFRPERVLGESFASLHGPVPGFVDAHAAARSMVRAMVERGPYVRFMWTLTADAELDHHPDVHTRIPWGAAERLFLRVERQTTVPLTVARASLFLVRTYVYPFERLTDSQQREVAHALDQMPPEVRGYKGLPARAELAPLLAPGQKRHKRAALG